MITKSIIFIALLMQIELSFCSHSLDLEPDLHTPTAKSFLREKDQSDDAGLKRLQEINILCKDLEYFIPDRSLNLFLGRSVGWIAAAESFRLEKGYSPHQGTWKTVHFSGGSSLTDTEERLYTSEQLEAYKNYLRSIGVTPKSMLEAENGIYLIDFILMGRTMNHFSKLLVAWCQEEMPSAAPPKINFIDISFTTNYRDDFNHKTALSPLPTQFLLSNETMNSFIHDAGEKNIGKDNSLVCSFKPEQWITWKNTLESYEPTKKAIEMHKDLKEYLTYAHSQNELAPLLTSPQVTPTFFGSLLKNIFSIPMKYLYGE